jgi:hypothetical protein
MEDAYFVAGGVYTDGSFSQIEDGTRESEGPFASLTEATSFHKARSSRMIDVCWHRLTIYKAEPV